MTDLTTFTTDAPRTRGDLRRLREALMGATLVQMLDYYIRCEQAATSPERAAFCQRMQGKVRESIGVTLGLARPKRAA